MFIKIMAAILISFNVYRLFSKTAILIMIHIGLFRQNSEDDIFEFCSPDAFLSYGTAPVA